MKMQERIRVSALGLAALCAMLPALAADPIDQACLDCHRDGADRGAVPIIEGQHGPYLFAQLTRFAEHHREGFPMNALAAGMDAERARGLAHALSVRDWPGSDHAGQLHAGEPEEPGAASPEPAQTVEIDLRQLAALDCAGCHGAHYLGGDEIPRLAGQREDYLQRQIEEFGDARRHHPPLAGGARMYMIHPDEAAALARSLSRLP